MNIVVRRLEGLSSESVVRLLFGIEDNSIIKSQLTLSTKAKKIAACWQFRIDKSLIISCTIIITNTLIINPMVL